MEQLGLVDALVQLSFVVQRVLGEAGAESDLTTVQMRLLGPLRDRELSMSELARHLGLDKSSVTGLVDRAESRGLVRRVASESDGRAVLVTLTPSAKRLADRVSRDVGRRVTDLTADLTAEEADTLAALAGRLLAVRTGA